MNEIVPSHYPQKEPLSNAPRGIVVWPNGLAGDPVVYPIGDTDEETERIRERLEGALGL